MILRAAFIVSVIGLLLTPATAQERVTVGTTRSVANGALFVAAAQGYFKAEGLDLAMTAYPSAQAVADALALGATEFGLAAFTPAAFNLAGKGTIKAIAAQAREQRDFEGNELVASVAAFGRGLRKPEDLAGKSVAIDGLGLAFHYQLAQIARIKRFDLARVTLKPMGSLDAMARAVGAGEVDAAILPPQYARDLLAAGQARLIIWASEIDEPQLGALFTTTNTIAGKRATVEKFLRAYRRGAADYAAALLRHDRYAKRLSDAKSQSVAAMIARYVYPGSAAAAIAKVEADAYSMDSQARLDLTDLTRRVEWSKAQGLIDKSVEARDVVDLSFTK
jgi:NitT/TauT family transport system substrate-binding protein